MAFHGKVFWAVIFFLFGVLLSSLTVLWASGLLVSVLIALLLSAMFFVLNKKIFAVLALFSILGSLYFAWDDSRYRAEDLFNGSFNGEARIVGVRERDSYLQADLETESGRVRAFLDSSKKINYGDKVLFNTKLRDFDDEGRRYFEKEGVHKISSYPDLEILEEGRGLKRTLYGFRDNVASIFDKYLVGERAVFMKGITLGRSSGFSDELSEKLSATGTTHLVALSGFNVAVIADGISYMLAFLLSRAISFYGSVAAIFLFIVMTGADASVVRAGIMASLILLANYSGQIFSVRTALVFSAFVMVLVNPKILAFDLGFQLSFLALIGIVYLKPILDRWLKLSGKSFLSWKGNLSMTLSAQLMVLPLILFSFGFMPAFSLLTNVLILTFIPITMLIGLLIIISSFISSVLASFFAFVANILLGYELAVVDFFSRFPFGIRLEGLSVALLLFVYGLAFLGLYIKYNKRDESRTKQPSN